jgi:hypothetical protein
MLLKNNSPYDIPNDLFSNIGKSNSLIYIHKTTDVNWVVEIKIFPKHNMEG